MQQKILQNPEGLNFTGLDTDLSLRPFFCIYPLSPMKNKGKSACGQSAGQLIARERNAMKWFASRWTSNASRLRVEREWQAGNACQGMKDWQMWELMPGIVFCFFCKNYDRQQ